MSVSRNVVRLFATCVASGALVGAAALPALANAGCHDRDLGRNYSNSYRHDGYRSGYVYLGDRDRDRDRGWYSGYDRDRDRGWDNGYDRDRDRGWNRHHNHHHHGNWGRHHNHNHGWGGWYGGNQHYGHFMGGR
jgi:hypothetical protein